MQSSFDALVKKVNELSRLASQDFVSLDANIIHANVESIITDVVETWKENNIIDTKNISQTVVNFSNLHTSYVDLLTIMKIVQVKVDRKLKQRLHIIRQWYYRSLSPQEEIRYGFPKVDPWKGLILTPKFKEEYLNADKDVFTITDTMKLLDEVLLPLIENLLKQVEFKHKSIELIIQWKRYENGF